ncbi:MAG: NAD-dependent epimerase/dehydratase family protein [Anaeroplasmataceae bacterium]
MKAVITGPTGAVGHALIQKLLNENIEIFAICRENSPGINKLNKYNINIVECDLNNLLSLDKIINFKIDYFYHLAWDGTYGESRDNYKLQFDNIKYTLDAVELAKALKCDVFICTGSQAEYGNSDIEKKPYSYCDPQNFYSAAKLSASYLSRVLCNKYNIKHIWCRIFSMFSPDDREYTLIKSTINKLRNNTECEFTEGNQIWNYIYSKDVANILYLCAIKGKNNSIYNVASNDNRTLKEYLLELINIVNPNASYSFGKLPYYSNQAMNLTADIKNTITDLEYEFEYNFESAVIEMMNIQLSIYAKNEF